MPRAIWSGAINFGLVNVPVKAYSAVRDHDVHFHQLEKKTGARIRYEKVSDKTGREIESDDIALGYEVARGKYVTVDPAEIEELKPKTTRTIDVADFVDLATIDPIYYQRTYWLAPDGEPARRAYGLLQAAMAAEGRVGVGPVVMRNKQYLAAVRPLDGALAMSTMRFADEIVSKDDIDAIPAMPPKADTKELKLACQIIDSLTATWDPARYHDTYTEQLRDVIERKAHGEEVVAEEAPTAPAKVLDLAAALQASVEATRKRPAADRHATAGRKAEADRHATAGRKAAAARKSASGGRAAAGHKAAPGRGHTAAGSGRGRKAAGSGDRATKSA